LDIYGTHQELLASFGEFASKLGANEKLFVRNGLPIQGITYGIEDGSDYCIENISIADGAYRFDVRTPKTRVTNIKFAKPGRHNLLNALVAFAMALEIGAPQEDLVRALESFKGVRRRFTYHINQKDFVFIDDYAHHPTEIEAVHQAISEMHPNFGTTVVFQPHLYSRTQDFAEGFALSLAKFDTVFLLDIYPARETPIAGITSNWLLDKIKNPRKKLIEKSALPEELNQCRTGVLVTLGAGDIGLEVPKIKKALAHAS